MQKIPTILEQELQQLTPSGLERSYMDRLLSSAEGTDIQSTDEERSFEKSLRNLSPRRISTSLDATLFASLSDLPFAVDEKIVLFNKASRNTKPNRVGKILRFNLAAAAAVALLGSVAALLVPSGQSTPQSLVSKSSIQSAPFVSSPVAPSNFAPITYNRNLTETRDEGVIWKNKNQPHRVLRLTFTDEVTLKNQKGESVQKNQPRFEYVIIPEKID